MARLTDLKLIDDAEFIRWYVSSRSRTRPRSSRLLARELKRKGLVVDPLELGQNDLELATLAHTQKRKSWSHLSLADQKLKAMRFLASRGFSWNVIEAVIAKAYNADYVS